MIATQWCVRTYDVTDHAKVYLEFQFMDDRTYAQIARAARSPARARHDQWHPNGAWAINCSNPYLSAAEFGASGFNCPGVHNAATPTSWT